MNPFATFVEAVRSIPSVEQVSGQPSAAGMHLVTYMSESSLAERFVVYAAQMQMYERFPQLPLAFDLIDRKGIPLEHGDSNGQVVAVIRTLPDLV
jgi:hypothetical protein